MTTYAAARTVTRKQIATELGWSMGKTKARLWNLQWLTAQYFLGKGLYNAAVIDALQKLFRQIEPEPDPLAQYLKDKEIPDGRRPLRSTPPRTPGPAACTRTAAGPAGGCCGGPRCTDG